MTTTNVEKPEQILSEKASLEIKEAVEKAMYSNECELIKSHLFLPLQKKKFCCLEQPHISFSWWLALCFFLAGLQSSIVATC